MGAQPHVLLVSRDSDFIGIYQFTLRESGFSVTSCVDFDASGLPASAAVVIVDVLAPEDWQIVGHLSEAQIPTIVVTGFIGLGRWYRDHAIQLGAAAFVLKPVWWGVLNDVIVRVLRGERGIEILPPAHD